MTITMEEWKDFNGYRINNHGKILNRRGREVKGCIYNDRGYKYLVVVLRFNGKRHSFHKNTLIYKLFGENYQKNAKVYQVDGDVNNCLIDNLKISRAYTDAPSEEQIGIYNSNIIGCVCDCFTKCGYWEFRKCGFDVDNLLGECYITIYKYLSSFHPRGSFYAFCKKITKWVFAKEYKKFMDEKEKLFGYNATREKVAKNDKRRTENHIL